MASPPAENTAAQRCWSTFDNTILKPEVPSGENVAKPSHSEGRIRRSSKTRADWSQVKTFVQMCDEQHNFNNWAVQALFPDGEPYVNLYDPPSASPSEGGKSDKAGFGSRSSHVPIIPAEEVGAPLTRQPRRPPEPLSTEHTFQRRKAYDSDESEEQSLSTIDFASDSDDDFEKIDASDLDSDDGDEALDRDGFLHVPSNADESSIADAVEVIEIAPLKASSALLSWRQASRRIAGMISDGFVNTATLIPHTGLSTLSLLQKMPDEVKQAVVHSHHRGSQTPEKVLEWLDGTLKEAVNAVPPLNLFEEKNRTKRCT